MLRKLHGKYYKLDLHDSEYKLLRYKQCGDLIGRTIYARSPVTCCCGEDEVCPKCIGLLAVTNSDIAEGVAVYESEEIAKVVEQNILSTKHLLTSIKLLSIQTSLTAA